MLLGEIGGAVALAADAVGAVGAVEGAVGSLPEALGMELEGELPNKENYKGYSAKAPCIHAGDEEKGSEHHDMVPVEDAASGAAAVFHKPNAEGTPK